MLRNKLTFTILFAVTWFFGQVPPPPFEENGGGGGGTTGTGSPSTYPSSNIDQFLYILFVIAVVVIFTVQYKWAKNQRKKRNTTTAPRIEKHLEQPIHIS